MSDIFTSVEFYITAFAVAIAVVAFFGSDSGTPQAASDICSPSVITPSAIPNGGQPTVAVHANNDGSIAVLRRGLALPPRHTVYVKIDFVRDNITITERVTTTSTDNNGSTATWCDLQFTTRPRPRRKYHVRYECAGGTLWGTTHFANYGGYRSVITLKS